MAWHSPVLVYGRPTLPLHCQRNSQGGGLLQQMVVLGLLVALSPWQHQAFGPSTKPVPKYLWPSVVVELIVLNPFPLLSYFMIFIMIWNVMSETCLNWLWTVSMQRGTTEGGHPLLSLQWAGSKRHHLSRDHLPYLKSILWDEMKHALGLTISLHQAACRDWLGRGLNLPEGGQFHS